MSGGASVRASVEDCAVGSQDGGPQLKRSMVLAPASVCGVPELHNRAARARPRAGLGIVDFRVRAEGFVRNANRNVRVDRENLAARQQRPPFFVVDVEFIRTGLRPRERSGIQEGRLRCSTVGLHVRTVW